MFSSVRSIVLLPLEAFQISGRKDFLQPRLWSAYPESAVQNLIELRPIRLEDFEPLCEAATDPLIWEQHPEPGRYKREAFQKFSTARSNPKVVVDLKSGKIIGSSLVP